MMYDQKWGTSIHSTASSGILETPPAEGVSYARICGPLLIHTRTWRPQLSRKCVVHMYRMACCMQHVMSDDAFMCDIVTLMCDIPHDYEFMCDFADAHPIVA